MSFKYSELCVSISGCGVLDFLKLEVLQLGQ